MKYCIRNSKNFKYIEDIDEVIFEYNKDKNLDLFKRLAEKPPHYRSIIKIPNFYQFEASDGFKNAIALKEKYSNFALAFDEFSICQDEHYKHFFQMLRENEISFFFSTLINNWEIFNGLIAFGVSDIYVVENLCFELDLLSPIAKKAGVSLRTYANVCQSAWKMEGADTLKTFFIRPEDVDTYENYLDVLEFFGDTPNVEEIMYKAYAKKKKWFGPLEEIIIGLDTHIDNRCIPSLFGVVRKKCGKKCQKNKRCNICSRLQDMSMTFEKQGYYIKND